MALTSQLEAVAKTMPTVFSVGELAIAAHELYPVAFGIKGHPEHVDTHKVHATLASLVRQGQRSIVRIGPDQYSAARTTLEAIDAALEAKVLAAQQSDVHAKFASRQHVSFSEAMQLWGNAPLQYLDFLDALESALPVVLSDGQVLENFPFVEHTALIAQHRVRYHLWRAKHVNSLGSAARHA